MGDTANTKSITLHNHSGTHIDFPNHFIINGKTYNKSFKSEEEAECYRLIQEMITKIEQQD